MITSILGIDYGPFDPIDCPTEIQADETKKLLIAKNTFNLPARTMILALYALMNDLNPAISLEAQKSFQELPTNIIKSFVDQDVPPQVLDFLACLHNQDTTKTNIIEKITLNKKTATGTLVFLIENSSASIVEMIANNQTRLKQSPELIFSFPKNKKITISVIAKVAEFGIREKIITAIQGEELIDEFVGKIKVASAEIPIVNILPVPINNEEQWAMPSFMTREFEKDIGYDSEALVDSMIRRKLNMREVIRQMTIPQRLNLAIRGNMEARRILLEDKETLISQAVLGNPRLTETEILRTIESRMTDPKLLEAISQNSAFLKTYQIRNLLVCNPKTPLKIANQLLSTLQEKDIRKIAKSKAVSRAIATIASQKLKRA